MNIGIWRPCLTTYIFYASEPFPCLNLQMYSCQDQQHQTDKEPPLPSVGVPASVIVSGNFAGLTPSGQDGPLAEPLPGQSPSPSPGPTHMAAVVSKVDEPMPCAKPHPLAAATAAYWITLYEILSPAHFSFHCASLSSTEHTCLVFCPLLLPLLLLLYALSCLHSVS